MRDDQCMHDFSVLGLVKKGQRQGSALAGKAYLASLAGLGNLLTQPQG